MLVLVEEEVFQDQEEEDQLLLQSQQWPLILQMEDQVYIKDLPVDIVGR